MNHSFGDEVIVYLAIMLVFSIVQIGLSLWGIFSDNPVNANAPALTLGCASLGMSARMIFLAMKHKDKS